MKKIINFAKRKDFGYVFSSPFVSIGTLYGKYFIQIKHVVPRFSMLYKSPKKPFITNLFILSLFAIPVIAVQWILIAIFHIIIYSIFTTLYIFLDWIDEKENITIFHFTSSVIWIFLGILGLKYLGVPL